MPPFRHSLPVCFADIDHAGIVYFPRFFHFVHLAMEAFFRQRVGARAYADLLDRDRVGFPAVETSCSFSAPLRFGDTMEVELSVARLGRSSITFEFRIFRALYEPRDEAEVAPGERLLCAHGRYVTAVVDLDRFRAIPIPRRLRDILEPIADAGQTGSAGA